MNILGFPISEAVFFVLATLSVVYIFIRTVQHYGLESARKFVYQGIVEAERRFKKGDNATKFDYVVQFARDHLPSPFGAFITETALKNAVQAWFDLCKEMLDYGLEEGVNDDACGK